MITRSKLVEQLREYQKLRSNPKWVALTVFSPKPRINTRHDVTMALSYALLFFLLITSFSVALYFMCFKLSAVILCSGILLPTCLKISRQIKLERKRELPLSM